MYIFSTGELEKRPLQIISIEFIALDSVTAKLSSERNKLENMAIFQIKFELFYEHTLYHCQGKVCSQNFPQVCRQNTYMQLLSLLCSLLL